MSDGGDFSDQLLYRGCQCFSSMCMCMCISMIGFGVYQAPVVTPQIVGGGLIAAFIVYIVCMLCMAFGAKWTAEQVEDNFLD